MTSAVRSQLLVYEKALASAVAAEHVARKIPPIRRDLRDQLRRAASSTVLNIAEGADEFSPSEKARFYRMARRSAAESLSVLDLSVALDLVAEPACSESRQLLREVSAMLTKMVHGQVERAARPK